MIKTINWIVKSINNRAQANNIKSYTISQRLVLYLICHYHRWLFIVFVCLLFLTLKWPLFDHKVSVISHHKLTLTCAPRCSLTVVGWSEPSSSLPSVPSQSVGWSTRHSPTWTRPLVTVTTGQGGLWSGLFWLIADPCCVNRGPFIHGVLHTHPSLRKEDLWKAPCQQVCQRDWPSQAPLEICPLWHHRWARPPRRVTDRWATFATVHRVLAGGLTYPAQVQVDARWTQPAPYDVIRGRFRHTWWQVMATSVNYDAGITRSLNINTNKVFKDITTSSTLQHTNGTIKTTTS